MGELIGHTVIEDTNNGMQRSWNWQIVLHNRNWEIKSRFPLEEDQAAKEARETANHLGIILFKEDKPEE